MQLHITHFKRMLCCYKDTKMFLCCPVKTTLRKKTFCFNFYSKFYECYHKGRVRSRSMNQISALQKLLLEDRNYDTSGVFSC